LYSYLSELDFRFFSTLLVALLAVGDRLICEDSESVDVSRRRTTPLKVDAQLAHAGREFL
jgi:hypothetical protein